MSCVSFSGEGWAVTYCPAAVLEKEVRVAGSRLGWVIVSMLDARWVSWGCGACARAWWGWMSIFPRNMQGTG